MPHTVHNIGDQHHPERRSDATIIDMLRQQIKDAASSAAATAISLGQHVEDCSKMQKRVLLVGAVTLVWVIAHSPEAASLVAKAFPAFGGP